MDKTKYALELARIVLLKGDDIKNSIRINAIEAINEALGEPRQKYIYDESDVGAKDGANDV